MSAKMINLEGKIKSAVAGVKFDGLTVKLKDQNGKVSSSIAESKVDKSGVFTFSLKNLMLKRVFQGETPEVYFVVKKDRRELFTTMDEQAISLDKEIIKVSLEIPKLVAASLKPIINELPKLDIRAILKSSGVKATDLDLVQNKLKKSGLSTLKQLLSQPNKLTVGGTGLNEKQVQIFKSLTQLSAAAGSEVVGEKILNSGITSLAQLGKKPYESAQYGVGKLNKKDQLSFDRACIKGVQQAIAIDDQVATHATIGKPIFEWLENLSPVIRSTPPRQCNCSGCSVFSPYAYVISLIDMLYDHWNLNIRELELMVLQDIDSLDCSSGEICFAQIELAVEVLEKRIPKTLPLTATQLSKNEFQMNFETIWARLLIAAERDNDKAVGVLREVERVGSLSEQKLIAQMRNPVDGIKSIRFIRDTLNTEPKLKAFQSTSPAYAEGGEAFTEALEQSYLKAVKLYRDALITNTGKRVESLQNELFTDLKAGSCKKTTRLQFLMLSLQAVILSGRTGKIKNDHNTAAGGTTAQKRLRALLNAKLKKLEQIPLEEASWKWLKDYPTWRSTMLVYLFPENAALPFLYEDMNTHFSAVLDSYVGTDNFNSLTRQLLGSSQDRHSVFKGILDYYSGEVFMETRNERNKIILDSNLALEEMKRIAKFDESNGFDDLISVKEFMNSVPKYIAAIWQTSDIFSSLDMFLTVGFNPSIYQLHIPLIAGFVLNKSENYESAHEWYQQIYDPTKPGTERFGFEFDAAFTGDLNIDEGWTIDQLNPNAAVHRRKGAMLRHVVLAMVKNLLDWADHEFAKGTLSSTDRARQLYELAQVTLDAPDLRDHCGQSIRELTISVTNRYSSNSELIEIIERLKIITDFSIVEKATADIQVELDKPSGPNVTRSEKIVAAAIDKFNGANKPKSISNHISQRDEIVTTLANDLSTNITASKVFESDGQVNNSLMPTRNYFSSTLAVTFCVPANPLLVALDLYIKVSLLKFQLCLDISGEPTEPIILNNDSVAEFYDEVINQYEPQSRANLPASWFNEPPRYRYAYLVEKARQYTDVAQRLGSALLVAYQSKDNENFQIMNAQHAIEISSSTVDLRNLGLRDAQFGLDIAELQLDKAENQLAHWVDMIANGLSETELSAIELLGVSEKLSIVAATIQAGYAAFLLSASSGTTGYSELASSISSTAGIASTKANKLLTIASFERREDDWIQQKTLSEFDSRIANAQRSSAVNRIDIAELEMGIAQLQHSQSREVLSFLENKFSSAQLYEWMISVLTQNYRTLMQIASNTAKLAQRALEFERQDHLSIVSGDYWSIAESMASGLSEEQKESGLLGAERLITDLTRLDAYKLTSEKRRQQVSKNVSMAQMLPNELLELKTTGRVSFNTLMHWFDRDFPGQYHRLIKGVRISMLALTPPTDGIHGSLSNSGESTVVVSDQANKFKPIRAFRQFDERITLDSPFNETGLFVFDYNDPMFLPFEGLGVETQWTLELPKAANRFNFDTLVDVIFTIEYTALYNDKYAGVVKEQLGDEDSNDIVIQPRLQTPDSWYHFINDPIAANNNRELSIDVTKDYLPAHYTDKDSVRTHHVTVVIAGDFSGLNSSQETKIKKAISVQHDTGTTTLTLPSDFSSASASTAERFNTKSFNSSTGSLFLSTRSDTNNALKLGSSSTVNPIGSWKIIVNDDLGGNTSFAELVEDVLVIITTEGDVDWG